MAFHCNIEGAGSKGKALILFLHLVKMFEFRLLCEETMKVLKNLKLLWMNYYIYNFLNLPSLDMKLL